MSDDTRPSTWVKCGSDSPFRMVLTPCKAQLLGSKKGYNVTKDTVLKNIRLGRFKKVDGEVKSGFKVSCRDNSTVFLVRKHIM